MTRSRVLPFMTGHPFLRVYSCVLAFGALTAFAVPASAQDRYHGISYTSAPAEGTSVRWGTATAILDFPLEDVTALVHDYAAFSDYLPHFQTSRVLAQRGTRARVYVEVTALNESVTMWAQMDVRSREVEGRRIITGEMTEGNLDHFRVRWELSAVDEGHTRVRFRLLADPDLPIPSSLITSENVKFAKKVIWAMRERLGAE